MARSRSQRLVAKVPCPDERCSWIKRVECLIDNGRRAPRTETIHWQADVPNPKFMCYPASKCGSPGKFAMNRDAHPGMPRVPWGSSQLGKSVNRSAGQ